MADSRTNYLIIGAGAVGLAFADTLLTEKPEAHITIVDRHGQPGGHWNDAYSFVALHQPSAFYGVNSLPLGSGAKDSHGVNAGLYELASGPEVSGYFQAVMQRQLLPSGQVTYLPMTDHLGGGRLRSLLTGAETQIARDAKLVDATYYGTSVPATHKPKFEIASGVRLITPNGLPHLARSDDAPPERYMIVGAGKTAMDVGVWLLNAGVPPERIGWVMPRDSWLLDRRNVQPGMEYFHDAIGGQAAQMEAMAAASSHEDLFDRLEAAGTMLRIYPEVRPTMFHYATISRGEVAALATIRDVVRMGHVHAIEPGRMMLAQGELTVPRGTLFIDCTASAVEKRQPLPMFGKGTITCQLVRAPQPAFSAALLAYIEAHYDDDDTKNALATPVPFPDRPKDFALTVLANLRNESAWSQQPDLRGWIRCSRLDGFAKLVGEVARDDAEKMAVLGRIQATAVPAAQNLQRLLG